MLKDRFLSESPRRRFLVLSIAAAFVAMLVIRDAGAANNLADDTAGRRSLESILQRVRDGERLFGNLDMMYVREYVLPSFKESARNWNVRDLALIKDIIEVVRVVFQDGLFYYRSDKIHTSTRGLGTSHALFAYDGKIRRDRVTLTGSLGDGTNVRVTDEREDVPGGIVTPCNMGGWWDEHCLSEHLVRGLHVVKGLQGEGRYPEDPNVQIKLTVEEDEVINGMACVRVRHRFEDTSRTDSLRALESVYWLAKENHYLPVRRADFWTRLAEGLPDSITEASDWREIEPGVRVPFKAVSTGFEYGRDGQRIVKTLSTITVIRISLRPAYEPEFFSDVPIPKGAYVYEEQGGLLIRSYIEGEPRPERGEINWSVAQSVLVNGGIVLVMAVICKLLWARRKTVTEHREASHDNPPAPDR